MSKHSVTIGVDGSIRVDHHNDDAPDMLQALSIAGGAQSVGAAPTGMSDFDSMLQEGIRPQTDREQAQHAKANSLFLAAHHARQEKLSRLNTATKIAQSMIQHGKTKGRNPDYIGDKAHAIANALHDKANLGEQPDFDAILKQVIADEDNVS